MNDYKYLIVKSDALPPVYKNVLYVKELLTRGEATSTSEAIRKAGISRSAYYKYKDSVFAYTGTEENNTLNLSVVLSDNAGKLSALTAFLYEIGANILTVNQSHPVGGKATVAITMRTDNIKTPLSELPDFIKTVDGVLSVKIV